LGLWTSALKLLSRPVVLRRRRFFPFQLRLGEITRCSWRETRSPAAETHARCVARISPITAEMPPASIHAAALSFADSLGAPVGLDMKKFLRKPEARLAPPPPTPRPVSAHEAEVIKRILHLEAGIPHVNELLASVDRLTVIEGCDCGCDSLYFHEPRDKGSPIVSGVGRTPGNNEVEVVHDSEIAATIRTSTTAMRPRSTSRRARRWIGRMSWPAGISIGIRAMSRSRAIMWAEESGYSQPMWSQNRDVFGPLQLLIAWAP
jgi:hypothetical protein